MSHLEELYAIAQKHNNSRSVTNGYMASAEYVQAQLAASAGDYCEVSTQEFKVPVWAELEIPELSSYGIAGGIWIHYKHMVDFQSFRYSGPSTRLLKQAIHGMDDNGCNPQEYVGVRGKVAVIEEGGPCESWDVAHRAEKAGATAVLFYNNPRRRLLLNTRIRITAWKEGDPLIQIPVLSITHSLGLTLLQSKETAVLNIKTVNSQTVESTINVLCTTKEGSENDVIVLGSHLDSVPEGPGMVDNGSGSSSLLEIALVLAKAKYALGNKIVFAWWGAEEIGLLGSRHYVRELVKDEEKKKQVVMNMNFDMLASPNYVPFVHDGRTAPTDLVSASSKIDHLLIEYFENEKKKYEYTEMTSGSDFLPFLLEGIPSGGLLTGAGERKTTEQRTRFGGFADAPLDPCYHKSCDTIENVNKHALQLMSQAALYAVTKVAKADNLRQWLVDTNVTLHY
ncbi:Leucyl aminopeptidase yscIV [Modicella reniformis]|uniref:Peptide hydrolase n=1 Tax=Modicella reniformis TaxID=1440133 RepID=A0A9P6M280_9FUNG|nr:Leucyl aminopeptidase yscIV [Modicella reniformis]